MSTAFGSFLVLLIISVVVSGVLHYGFKFYVRAGTTSFISKVIIGWVGAWLGAPVFGLWGPSYGVGVADVAYGPAILGSAALLVLVVDVTKSISGPGQG